LRFTAQKFPKLSTQIHALADELAQSKVALVHGDVSPKNILLRNRTPIFLDAECATMGDPAFDVAFCLNHLLLKSFHLPGSRTNLRDAVQQFWQAYQPHICWEEDDRLQARVAALLPALLLARVEGKSPVEYLSDTDQDKVRIVACACLSSPVDSISALLASRSAVEGC